MDMTGVVTRSLAHFERHGLQREGVLLLWLLALLLRWVVALHSYSGMRTPPMFGDYEAQRHWMEVTLQTPLGDWYFNTTSNDLLYWGLDYPPLTAYWSYAFGKAAQIVEPDLVALQSSRGYETPTSKVFMRASVIVCDVLLFMPAVFLVAKTLYYRQAWTQRMYVAVTMLLHPSLLLIDHGHFQYNNVCLGFTLLAIALLWSDRDVLGSIAFCLALNFKQMALYFAPAIGMYLLAKCLHQRCAIVAVAKLGIAVVATFGLLWFPFCLFARSGETCSSSIFQVVHRIFPFARGLFEDKVANFWCVLDLFLKLRRRLAPALQMRLCTVTTFLGFAPSVVDLARRKPTKLRFLLALVNCSLSFFLFSFQVHEKTILLPLLPVMLLMDRIPLLSSWFGFVSSFSMFFLLRKDGLALPYFVLQVGYWCVVVCPHLWRHRVQTDDRASTGRNGAVVAIRYFVLISTLGAVVLHAMQALITPPRRYPHIFDYAFAAFSFVHFLGMLIYCTYWQWTTQETDEETSEKTIKTE